MIDLETCSWCGTEVPYSTLKEAADGAMVCRECRTTPDYQPARRR